MYTLTYLHNSPLYGLRSSMVCNSNNTISHTLNNELHLLQPKIHLYSLFSIPSLTHQLVEQLGNDRKLVFQRGEQRKHREIRSQQLPTQLHLLVFLRNELNGGQRRVFGLNELERREEKVGNECFL